MSETNSQERTLEESFAQLSGVVERLENDDLPLEESFATYQKGMKLLKECNEKIDTVEKKMIQLNANGETSEL